MVTVESFIKLALSFQDVVEHSHFDKMSFRINNKIFATLDVDKNQACVKLSEIDQFAFSSTGADPAIFAVPNKWGKQGWTFLNLGKIDESSCLDALSTAFREVQKKKLQKKN